METSNLESLLKQHLAADQSRLDRIETKIDKLSDTVVALARAEEKLFNLEASRMNIIDTLEEHEERLDNVDRRLADGDVTLNTITKLTWVIVGSALAAVFALLIN